MYMNKVKGLGLVIVDNMVVARECKNWEEAESALYEYLSEFPEEHDKRIEFVNYVAHLDSDASDYRVLVHDGEPHLNDLNFSTSKDCVYVVEDYEKEFDDEDELKDWIKRQIERGELSIDEVRSLEITQRMDTSVAYEDAEEGENTYEIEFTGAVASSKADHFGDIFVLASEAEDSVREVAGNMVEPTDFEAKVKEAVDKELARNDIKVFREPSTLTDEEIDTELKSLQERIWSLQLEKAKSTL